MASSQAGGRQLAANQIAEVAVEKAHFDRGRKAFKLVFIPDSGRGSDMGKGMSPPGASAASLYDGQRKPRSPALQSLHEAVTIGHALLGSTHKYEFLLHSYHSIILHPLLLEAIDQESSPICRVSFCLQTWTQLAPIFSCPSVSSAAVLALGQFGGLDNVLVVCFLQTVSFWGGGQGDVCTRLSATRRHRGNAQSSWNISACLL